MITSATWRGKRYAVLGLARSGLASVRALVASGADVVAWDGNEDRREETVDSVQTLSTSLDTASITLTDPVEIELSGFAGIAVAPGVPLNRHPIAAKARNAGVPAASG